jgi:hypothetical protein
MQSEGPGILETPVYFFSNHGGGLYVISTTYKSTNLLGYIKSDRLNHVNQTSYVAPMLSTSTRPL